MTVRIYYTSKGYAPIFILGLCVLAISGCDRNKSIILQTHKQTLEYSVQLEYNLSFMGLMEISTKLEPIEEIEAISIRYARIPSTLFSGQIFIIDADNNKFYNDDSIDFIGLANMNRKLEFQTINWSKLKQPTIIKINHEAFDLTIEKEGKSIELNKIEKDVVDFDLTYPYRLPNRKVTGLNEDIILNKGNNKYTYIEFWGTWCKPCIKLIPELKTLNKYYSGKLNLISINYGDKDIDNVRAFVKIKKMNWDQVVADKQLIKDFGNPRFVPCGMLFNPDGYLVKYGILPGEVRAYLKKK